MKADKQYIINLRREFHQIPEIGFDLPKSLAIIRRELANIGLPYREDVGRSCIIATLNEGVGSKTIALRADMDALPMPEETGLSKKRPIFLLPLYTPVKCTPAATIATRLCCLARQRL